MNKTWIMGSGAAVLVVAILLAVRATQDDPAPAADPKVKRETDSRAGSRSDRTNGSSGFPSRTPSARIERELQRVGVGEALDRILSIADPLERRRELEYLAEAAVPDDFPVIFSALEGTGNRRGSVDEREMVLVWWARKDPVGGLAYLNGLNGKEFLRQAIIGEWATGNPSAAENWVRSNTVDDEAEELLAAVAGGIALSDFHAAVPLLEELPASRIGSLVEALGEHRGPEVAKWAEGIRNEDRAPLLAKTAEGWFASDPEASFRWVQGLPADDQVEMAKPLVGDIGGHDFDRAAAWLRSLENSGSAVDEAWMELAYTELNRGNRERATLVFQRLAGSGSSQSVRAANALETLARQAAGAR